MTTPRPPVFVRSTRGGLDESLHRGHLVAARPDGTVVAALGDPDFPTFLRSTAKPLQAVPVVSSGAADRFGITPAELALMCGSVSGQAFHVAAVRSVLGKAGLGEDLLACGVHRPSHRPTARRMAETGEPFLPVHNNCAGKHAAMLLLCAHHGWSPRGYTAPDHPVQQLVLETVARLCGVGTGGVGVGVDGCGVPVFRLPLRHLARAYARLAGPDRDPGLGDDDRAALGRLAAACTAHPEMVAGDERVCTEVMRAGRGGFMAKTGAEGSYGIALLDRGIGIALKIEDGALRALDPVVVEVLRQARALTADQVAALARFHRPVVRNHRKEVIGQRVAVLDLGGTLAP